MFTFSIIDHIIETGDDARLKTALAVNTEVFALIAKAFEDYLTFLKGNTSVNVHIIESFMKFSNIIWTDDGAPRDYKVAKVFKKFAAADRALFLGSANVSLAD